MLQPLASIVPRPGNNASQWLLVCMSCVASFSNIARTHTHTHTHTHHTPHTPHTTHTHTGDKVSADGDIEEAKRGQGGGRADQSRPQNHDHTVPGELSRGYVYSTLGSTNTGSQWGTLCLSSAFTLMPPPPRHTLTHSHTHSHTHSLGIGGDALQLPGHPAEED